MNRNKIIIAAISGAILGVIGITLYEPYVKKPIEEKVEEIVK